MTQGVYGCYPRTSRCAGCVAPDFLVTMHPVFSIPMFS
jgi:hypothetical protein